MGWLSRVISRAGTWLQAQTSINFIIKQISVNSDLLSTRNMLEGIKKLTMTYRKQSVN